MTIEKSNSLWSSPVVLITKIDWSVRFCIDDRIRQLSVTHKPTFWIHMVFDVGVKEWVHSHNKEKIAFITNLGLYKFTIMPFGLSNALVTFERLMEHTFEKHLRNLQEVFNRFRAPNLRPNKEKLIEFIHHDKKDKGNLTTISSSYFS